jgi:acylphosphatase
MTSSRSKEIRQAHFRAFGRVQGVCFRWFVQEEASRRGLGGWVRNNPDGTVEGAARGPGETVRALLDRIRQGPSLARVEKLDVEWESPSTALDEFRIRP